MSDAGVQVSKSSFGHTKDGKDVDKYTLRNSNNVSVDIITYGGIVTSVHTPDKDGNIADVVTGFDSVAGYEDNTGPYFGALIGRVANRIRQGQFFLDGEEYNLAINNGPNHLHGGIKGFDKQIWTASEQPEGGLTLTYISVDGEEQYPGELTTTVIYKLTNDNELIIDYMATTDKATIVNLTNHSYFNLAGHKEPNIYDHLITINAEKYTPKNEDNVPTGGIMPVEGTLFDLREATRFADRIHKIPVDMGYDHNFCLAKGDERKLAARLEHPGSGRVLEVSTTHPGIQVYTGNYLDGIHGKDGAVYHKHSAVALETQDYPDSMNHPNFPSIVLRPGKAYHHTTWFKFFTK